MRTDLKTLQQPLRTAIWGCLGNATRKVQISVSTLALFMGVAIGTGLFAPSVLAQGPIVIQFSHVVTAETPKGRAALKFKELAEARTAGKVRVEVYPNSQLYKDREEMNALKIGAVQMLAPSLSKLGGDFEAFDLPFLFKDHAAYRRVVDSPIGAELLAKLNERGFKGLAYWDNGFKVFTANRPLVSVKDFKGLKIRVQASRALVNQMEVLGSEASISPLINVYEALRSGKLDGQENTPINITSQRINEVQSHLTVSNHGYLAYAVIVNKVFWEKLPADIRQILEEAMREATRFANSIAEQENNKATERMAANPRLHIYRLSLQEAETWRKALDPVYVKTQAWISQDLLRSIRQASGAPP